jgi:hypothetical protein
MIIEVRAIIYGDTDSVYFSAYKPLQKEIDAGTIPWEKENIIALYDKIADEVNTIIHRIHDPGIPLSKIARRSDCGRQRIGRIQRIVSSQRKDMQCCILTKKAIEQTQQDLQAK